MYIAPCLGLSIFSFRRNPWNLDSTNQTPGFKQRIRVTCILASMELASLELEGSKSWELKGWNLCTLVFFYMNNSGQIIATSHVFSPPNGGLVREIPLVGIFANVLFFICPKVPGRS